MENERTGKTKNTILWVISIFLMLSMIVYIGQATTQAILMGILGLLVMPPINKKINEKIINGNKTKNTIKIISEIILFFVIVCNIPTNENTSITNTINNQNINNTTSTVSQINNTIANNEDKENENTVENNTINQINTIQNQNSTQSVHTETTQNNNSSVKTEPSTNIKTTTKTSAASTSTNNSSSTNNSTTKSSSTTTSSSSTNTANKQTASSSSQSTNVDNSRTVYVTPTGKRYHYISTCGGKNSTATTLNKAITRGLTPCQKCAK